MQRETFLPVFRSTKACWRRWKNFCAFIALRCSQICHRCKAVSWVILVMTLCVRLKPFRISHMMTVIFPTRASVSLGHWQLSIIGVSVCICWRACRLLVSQMMKSIRHTMQRLYVFMKQWRIFLVHWPMLLSNHPLLEMYCQRRVRLCQTVATKTPLRSQRNTFGRETSSKWCCRNVSILISLPTQLMCIECCDK